MASHPRAVPRTKLERDTGRQARDIVRRIGEQLRTAREDAGLSLASVAQASGLSKSRLHDIEAGTCQPRWETIARVGATLGLRLGVGLYPGSGPIIRDHLQAGMIGSLLAITHERWQRRLEVAVYRPVRGVIDLVLDARDERVTLCCEAFSELRRLEQQVRWSHAKADALASTRQADGDGDPNPPRPVARLLLLRSTDRTRAVVAQYADVVAAAYPARAADAYAALTGTQRWPGDTLVWCRVEDGQSTILDRPPRGIRVGR
jgi:transcriptional regulator with XRE-family HTH domain